MMPHPNQHRAAPALRRPALSLVTPAEPTNAEVLLAVHALETKLDQLLACIAPRRSALTLDPNEVARTMAMLQKARPIPKETPP